MKMFGFLWLHREFFFLAYYVRIQGASSHNLNIILSLCDQPLLPVNFRPPFMLLSNKKKIIIMLII